MAAGVIQKNVTIDGVPNQIALSFYVDNTVTPTTFIPVNSLIDPAGTNVAAVKPASTAPAATDPALVVALSPNGLNPNGAAASSASAPFVAASDQATLAVAQDVSQLLNGKSGVSLTPATAKVNVAAATTTTVVAAVAAKKIRILSAYLVVGAANNVNWQSHTTTSNGDSPLDFAANGGFVLPFSPVGWFDTTAGEALDIVTSTTAQLSGRIVYVAV